MADLDDDDAGGLRAHGDLDFEPVEARPPKKRSKVWLFFWFLVLVAGGGFGSWYYLKLGDKLDGWLRVEPETEIPFIRAESGPVKVRPESPGGMDVPNQDKLVYERLQGGEDNPPIERLLPRPETPLPKPAPETAPLKEAAPAVETDPLAEEVEKLQPAPASPPPSAEAQPEVPTSEEVAAVKQPEVAPPPPGPKVLQKGDERPARFTVQLAAVRSPERAQGEWDRLRGKYPKILGDLTLSVVKVDLGPKKGIYYRLRVGPILDELAARDLCAKLGEKKVGCLIIRPEE